MDLDAPIAAVTVHPERARITRKRSSHAARRLHRAGRRRPADHPARRLGAGGRQLGHGGPGGRRRPAAPRPGRVPDDRVRAAEAAVRDGGAHARVIDGKDAADVAREQMLSRLARRSGDRLAAALADGRVGTARVGEVGAAVAAQLVEVADNRRGHAERRSRPSTCGAPRRPSWTGCAAPAGSAAKRWSRSRRRRAGRAGAGAELRRARRRLVLGVRRSGGGGSGAPPSRLDLTWFGMVRAGHRRGLAGVRPDAVHGASGGRRPPSPSWSRGGSMCRAPAPVVAYAAMRGPAPRPPADVRAEVAAGTPCWREAMNGVVAASWRLARPTAVPGDGTPHRTTITAFALPARLDHVTAPALSPEAHLRATVTNDSGQVLLAGPVSTFSGRCVRRHHRRCRSPRRGRTSSSHSGWTTGWWSSGSWSSGPRTRPGSAPPAARWNGGRSP